jgi:hypothetical protein
MAGRKRSKAVRIARASRLTLLEEVAAHFPGALALVRHAELKLAVFRNVYYGNDGYLLATVAIALEGMRRMLEAADQVAGRGIAKSHVEKKIAGVTSGKSPRRQRTAIMVEHAVRDLEALRTPRRKWVEEIQKKLRARRRVVTDRTLRKHLEKKPTE